MLRHARRHLQKERLLRRKRIKQHLLNRRLPTPFQAKTTTKTHSSAVTQTYMITHPRRERGSPAHAHEEDLRTEDVVGLHARAVGHRDEVRRAVERAADAYMARGARGRHGVMDGECTAG